MSKGNVFLTCGKFFKDVTIDNVSIGTKITVFNNSEDKTQVPSGNAYISCLSCPVKRKSGRKEIKFFTKNNITNRTKPTGFAITCKINKIAY